MTYLEQLTAERKQRLQRMKPIPVRVVPKIEPEIIEAHPQESEPSPPIVVEITPVDEPLPEPVQIRPSVSKIKRFISDLYGVSELDMESERKTKNVVLPRQIAMHLSRRLTHSSLPRIGQKFGGRDHTTVMHADQKLTRLRAIDPELEANLVEYERVLSGQ